MILNYLIRNNLFKILFHLTINSIRCSSYLFMVLAASSVLNAEVFYRTNELFMPGLGSQEEALPQLGHAISLVEYHSGDLRVERRKHYLNGQLLETWHYRYSLEGTLHSKAQVDSKARRVYEERYFYRPNHTLWLVRKTTATYQLYSEGLYWQHNNRLIDLAFLRPATAKTIAPTPFKFKLNTEAVQQVEEIWQEGNLVALRVYRYGKLEREREFGEGENTFIERMYYNDVALLEREVVLGVVVAERSLLGVMPKNE